MMTISVHELVQLSKEKRKGMISELVLSIEKILISEYTEHHTFPINIYTKDLPHYNSNQILEEAIDNFRKKDWMIMQCEPDELRSGKYNFYIKFSPKLNVHV